MSDTDYRSMWMQAAADRDTANTIVNVLRAKLREAFGLADIPGDVEDFTVVQLAQELCNHLTTSKLEVEVHDGKLRGHQFHDALRREFGKIGTAGASIAVLTPDRRVLEIVGITTQRKVSDDTYCTWIMVEDSDERPDTD